MQSHDCRPLCRLRSENHLQHRRTHNPKFAERLGRAENSSEFTFLSRIFKAGNDPKYWRSAAWGLERMFPDRFGARSPDSVTPKQLAMFISRLMEMLVEEIPVARYRRKVLARLDQIIKADDFPNTDDPAPARKPRTV